MNTPAPIRPVGLVEPTMSPASHGAAARGLASNRTLGQQVHDALVAAAEKKAESLRLRKKADRFFDIALLSASGKNADERKAAARLSPDHQQADYAATEAECAAIVAKAEADGLDVEFKEWQAKNANERAEMNLR